MFIIQSGLAQVKGGPDGQTVFVTLGKGSVFGEIALLGVDGMNRRTADVVSVGFSNFFMLKRKDLESVLVDYPEAKKILGMRARKLIRQNAAKVEKDAEARENVIFEKRCDPALLQAVLVMMAGSKTAAGMLSRPASIAGTDAPPEVNKAKLRTTQSQDIWPESPPRHDSTSPRIILTPADDSNPSLSSSDAEEYAVQRGGEVAKPLAPPPPSPSRLVSLTSCRGKTTAQREKQPAEKEEEFEAVAPKSPSPPPAEAEPAAKDRVKYGASWTEKEGEGNSTEKEERTNNC
jgi:hypothetical protein